MATNDGRITARQRQVLQLLRSGLSQKEAAHRLGIAHSTVRKHALDARRRTNTRSTLQLVTAAPELVRNFTDDPGD